MVWDLSTVLLHEEMPQSRTCLFGLKSGDKFFNEKLCQKKGCITCMAIKYPQMLSRERTFTEGQGS
eukprot:16139340-Heterocapsa_arctica.AAC.1